MTLDVGFVLEVEAVFVAQVIEVGVVGVVAQAHVVDVALLHEHYLVLHLPAGDGVARRGVVLVAVHALELHGLVVDVEIASGQPELVLVGRCLANLHLAYAEVGAHALNDLALAVLQRGHEHVAVGRLGAPGACVGNEYLGVGVGVLQGGHGGLRLVAVKLHGEHLVVQRVLGVLLCQGDGHEVVELLGGFLLQRAADFGSNVHDGAALGHEGRAHGQVAHLELRACREVDRAVDARQAEHVLRLEEGAVAVAVDLDGHHVVVVGVEIGGDVEACRVAAVLREANVVAVNPEIEEGVDAVEVDEHVAAAPFDGDVESSTIRAHFVAELVGRPVGGRRAHDTSAPVVDGHLVLEDYLLVGVYGHAVAHGAVLLESLHVPVARNGDVVPSAVVERGLPEGRVALRRFGSPAELPRAVETAEVGASVGQHAQCLLLRGVGEQPCARLFLVQRQALG